jgi:indolepyruvate ferredoxin oxidoreductase, beta subunit
LETTNIIICGVGGQGIILVSKVLSEAALKSGFDIKQTEVHGMAQRGGSVVSHVRFGKKIYSPVIQEGTADYILGFEKMEAVRYLKYLKDGGTLICNDLKIKPVSLPNYPDADVDKLLKSVKHILIDGPKYCADLGETKVLNIFLLGVLSNFLPFSNSVIEEVIKSLVKEKFVEINSKAYYLGRKEGLK